jgi:hypothetical protein
MIQNYKPNAFYTMRLRILILLYISVNSFDSHAQSSFKEFKAGHEFYVSLPDYMNKTVGINSAASIQFKNSVKDIAGFIIEDNKEELSLAEMHYASLNEFYDDFIKDFLKDEDKRHISEPVYQKKGQTNYVESDATYYDKESNIDIYYFVGIVETKTAFYKILCYGGIESKDKYKKDFENIMVSLRD